LGVRWGVHPALMSLRKGKKKRKNKYEYEYHQEPICECMGCGDEHLRRHRNKKSLKKEDNRFICVYLCPRCGGESYVFVGDKITKRRVEIENE